MKFTLFKIILFTFVCSLILQPTGAIKGKRKLKPISESLECSDDVRRLCGHTKRQDDLALLNCLQDNDEVMKEVSSECQHFLWSYKKNLTNSEYLEAKTNEKCDTTVNELEECRSVKSGQKISCLLDHKNEITNKSCVNFLNKVGIFVFADYLIIHKFIDRCEADVQKFKCGRIDKSKDPDIDEEKESQEMSIYSITSQAKTIDCLVTDILEVSKHCQHEILRLSELQSDDFHLNRKLYLACRDDRETMCPNVLSGEGRVYSCLMKHKFDDRMSKQCQEQLTKKQQIEGMDVKADFPLFVHCKQDIVKYQCASSKSSSDEQVLEMSTVLLCLEDAEIRGNKIDANCKAELSQRRLEMIEDFRVSPEVVVKCKDDVKTYCDNTDRQPGAVLHCLMKLAEADKNHPKGKIGKECRMALTELLRSANPTEDIMLLDPTIRELCSSSFSTLCEGVNSKDQAFQCLVQNIASPDMAPDCRNSVKSILYFISYDFSIDFAVQRACHNDAVKYCDGPKNVREMEKRTETARKLEYHCMYRHFIDDKIQRDIAIQNGEDSSKMEPLLSTECSNEIFRLVKAQSSQFQLDPIVFDACMEDFSDLCSNRVHNYSGHVCLQQNFQKIKKEQCKKAVIEFSQMEDTDIRLNRRLSEACMPMTKLFCSNAKQEDIIQCLIFHKRHPDMIQSCQAAIEHVQIINLEEYRIDHRFSKFCEKEINTYCSKELANDRNGTKIISKREIVSCLSKAVVTKLVDGHEHPLSKMCRRQFSFELLQRSDSITLDKNLIQDCKNDIKKFCSKEDPDKVSTCLRKHQDELENQCHRRIFNREQLESYDANFDGRLIRVCHQMIKEHCSGVSGTQMFQCLHRKMKDFSFDSDCKQLLLLRLERRMNDIRLNPGLLRDCKGDIEKYCGKSQNNLVPNTGLEFEGTVIQCLKEKFSNDSKLLQPVCRERILKIIIEANAFLRLDPVLRRNCMLEIKEHCNNEMMNQFDISIGTVHDCLKHKFLKKEINSKKCGHEINRLLKEGRADIHVDVQLFDACEETIMKLCRTENFGDGKKMSCLLYFADDPKGSKLMDSRCLDMIKDRREMWSFAASFEPQSFQDLIVQINQSSMRTYLFSMLGLMISALILLGICCGRITKRVPVDLKNK